MGRVEKSIKIRALPEQVWELLALDRFQEWLISAFLPTEGMTFTSEVNTPEDKYRVGASAQDGKGEETFEVTESLKNEKITYLIGEEAGTNAGTLTLVLEPIVDGTQLTYAVSYEMPGGIFGKFIEKTLGKRLGEREIKKSLENLKNVLEK